MNVKVNYPLWDLFVTMFELFIWVVLIFLVIRAVLSIFRSQDLSGWGKAAWLLLVILVPFIGVFAYLIVRGAHLAGEQMEQANAPQDDRSRAYERFEAQGRHSAGDLTKLADLRDRGVITDAEFQRGKAQLLG
ncbi:MAG: SHOCT domain-containing protein [Streptosporangiaceae bacterium]